ncbi:hypothetical protein [Alloactinosynnema sp. L-07]|uniref:hypothetical protein n=1 Tax=Alloactinosynnema sp. L-07 TaxID=1653480 RepID=UPI00065F050E|nr:hypothetical protein [Alloactinosynnema sp. L-07]CRK61206.1 hypothetical protein [Alloactinosynnema sp. L-07]
MPICPGPAREPFLLRALRKVERGEIVAATRTSPFRHRTEELPARLCSALFILRRDGVIALAPDRDPLDGWLSVELTEFGRAMLRKWVPA